MTCEMCGNKPASYQVEVEGTSMLLCEQCATFGKVVGKLVKYSPEKKQKRTVPTETAREERVQVIIARAGRAIKEKREQLGLKQEELAKRLNEKESLLHQIESSKFIPSIALARKFEKALGLVLVEEHTEKHDQVIRAKDETLTIGDLMK
ncbi:MAG: multiprotein bridging factor aMBF1 [archaeon]